MICLFSDMVLGTNTLISPCSKYLAIVSNSRLTIRDSETMGIIHIFPGVDTIDKVMFSPDSQYIMMCTFRRNTVQIFSLLDGDWRCRINEGVASIVNAQWTPDSRGVITESDFGIQLSVWSLVDSSSHYMLKPKESFYSNSTTGGSSVTALSNPLKSIQLVSSPDIFIQHYSTLLSCYDSKKRYFAVVHRIDIEDYLAVYATGSWNLVSRFKCKSNDICAITFCPDDKHIVTIDR